MLAKINVTPPGTYTAPSGYTTYIDFKIVSADTTVTAALSSGLDFRKHLSFIRPFSFLCLNYHLYQCRDYCLYFSLDCHCKLME